MMTKTVYEEPLTRVIEVKLSGVLLNSIQNQNVESMTSVAGSWDEDPDA